MILPVTQYMSDIAPSTLVKSTWRSWRMAPVKFTTNAIRSTFMIPSERAGAAISSRWNTAVSSGPTSTSRRRPSGCKRGSTFMLSKVMLM